LNINGRFIWGLLTIKHLKNLTASVLSFPESRILDKIEGPSLGQRSSHCPRVERWAGLGGSSCEGGRRTRGFTGVNVEERYSFITDAAVT